MVIKLHALELLLLPKPGLHRGGGLGNMSREGNHQSDRVFRGRDVVAFGRVHDDDAVLGRRADVDVVDPDSGATTMLDHRTTEDQRQAWHEGHAAARELDLLLDVVMTAARMAGLTVTGRGVLRSSGSGE